MSIGAPTGGAIWTEPARPSLGVAVAPLRWIRRDDGALQLASSGTPDAAFRDNGDGTFTLVDGLTSSDVGTLDVAGVVRIFGGSTI